ncbi:hypothetical protein F511_12748 [Dorcoceras hygrometricum]|uniref:Uncharacterized protein n=1 Tax=Dorcoceras hygrometricum TaxID=472368 RepID=A0A2Z7BR77_9LAMI|nr:hypothetical protein F511_12748 [Dorcoceras hygrometricum]
MRTSVHHSRFGDDFGYIPDFDELEATHEEEETTGLVGDHDRNVPTPSSTGITEPEPIRTGSYRFGFHIIRNQLEPLRNRNHETIKHDYCTLTTTNWFLQALSVIPRESCGDVARRFTMIRWLQKPPPPPLKPHARPPPAAAPPPSVRSVIRLVSITAMRSFRPCQNPSDLLVQIDGGILNPVVDLIDDLPPPTV